MSKKLKKGATTFDDADGYIAKHDAPLDWIRVHKSSPLSLQFKEGHEITDEWKSENGGENPILHFWGFKVAIGIVDFIRERRNEGKES